MGFDCCLVSGWLLVDFCLVSVSFRFLDGCWLISTWFLVSVEFLVGLDSLLMSGCFLGSFDWFSGWFCLVSGF